MQRQSTAAATAPGTLVDLLSLRTSELADEVLYRFLSDEGTESRWTYADLLASACRIAAALDELAVEGEPVLLLYPTGLEYVAAFFGCLYAGAIAVPAYPPRPGRSAQRLETIVRDSGARVALTTATIGASLELRAKQSPLLRSLACLATDELPATAGSDFRARGSGPDTVAFLQYTSGSTGDPKGVAVTHGNLLHNLSAIYESFDAQRGIVAVSWLPIYHDMGLIGGILGPVYGAGSVTLLTPKRFQEEPLAWLQAIGKYGATHAAAPNFAYDWCLRRTTPEMRAKLDLSSWQVAFCGAEPVRQETLTRFSEAFAPAGFRPGALRPCYGLAEATLMVTSRKNGESLLALQVSRSALEQGQFSPGGATPGDSLSAVASGSVVGSQRVIIVDPETCHESLPGRVGEIWVQGPSVAAGYWKRPELSAAAFEARLANSGEGPFLRTGDLGCFYGGQLFVTGRIKDLIIVRGRNHYPQDIEFTAQSSHADLQAGGGVAFALSEEGQEQILLVHEVRREAVRSLDAAAVIRAICQSVAREHEVRLDAVGLVRPGSIARTTSGKTERFAARQRFAAGQFEFIELWKPPGGKTSLLSVADEEVDTSLSVPAATVPAATVPAATVPATAAVLVDWISSWLARRLELLPAEIDVGQPLALYGLDSLMAVELTHDVELAFGHRLDVGELIDAPSIARLAERLAGDLPQPAAGRPPVEIAAVAGPGVVRPTFCGPWGDRAEGVLVRGESPMREIMPYLMRGRNESVVYHEASYDVGRALAWLEAYNREHTESRATLLDLFLWAAASVAHARPGINRFISGRRIYQRREVAISFAAKRRYDLSAELVTIKLRFPRPTEPFPDCVERIGQAVAEACQGPPRAVDRETALAMRLPRFLLRTILWGYRVLDHCNLLPGKLIANDPLYATMFVANLGSLGMDSATHHLYEHGTCSLFAALGLPKKTLVATADGRSEIRHMWPVRWTLDERIIDGFYSAGCLRLLKAILESPADFVPAAPHPGGPT